MVKRKQPAKKDTQLPMLADTDGQFTFFPEIPDTVQRAHGPVVDSVMSQSLSEQQVLYLDDTDEATETPIPIQTRVMISYETLGIEGNVKLNAFDREVIDAVASLAGCNDIITPTMIYKVMVGKKEYQRITEHQQELVRKSMQKCGAARLKIDLTDMLEKHNPIGRQLRAVGQEATFTGTLLAFETISFMTKSGKRDYYRILTEPALIRYAVSIGRVTSFPLDLMDTKVSKTERNIMIQSFLLHCIDDMYRGESDCLIEMSRLYRAIDAENDATSHKVRHRDVAATILNDWVDKNYIESFSVRKAGRLIKGFEIKLMPALDQKPVV